MVNENTLLPDEDHYICTQVVMYQTRATKDSYVNRIMKNVKSSIEKGKLSYAKGTTKIENWKCGRLEQTWDFQLAYLCHCLSKWHSCCLRSKLDSENIKSDQLRWSSFATGSR
ncbi:hypothetical protein B9Z19DRAFT_1127108 [Tuber borchii]|uniref:Uncharacterized protein n=1 Tax=Tuber borchii TaxID=42251 RepID=A0A2T6ZRX5_TUBBO|nr:hypothetical protein B9Z19DRAFT_1127108 [Tuber borchii]